MQSRNAGLLGFFILTAVDAHASGSAVSAGDTAWVMISTALVLLMTPGLALFYAGMVRSKNVVSTLLKNFGALGAVGVLWALVGYSLAFGPSYYGLIGNLKFAVLSGVGQEPNTEYAPTIPHIAFVLFQCMFAIITPALITGAIVERIRFTSWLAIMVLWSLFVYVPVAHWVWATDGWIRALGALDFAGGLVVHMTAGYAALVMARLLGRRSDISHAPHDIGMVMLGTALLFFGWFGFNGGSALAANGLASQAFATTFFAGSGAMVSWMLTEWFYKGKPAAIGACVGAVAGLVAITPAAGFVTVGSALIIGLLTGSLCFASVAFIKARFSFDDSLDVFGCHGVGGTLGAIFTAVFADKAVNPAGADGLLLGNFHLLEMHLVSMFIVAFYSMVVTAGIVTIVRLYGPIRVDEEAEAVGLDLSQHGEVIN